MAQADTGLDSLTQAVDGVYGNVVDWSRDIHQNPELSNREFRTSKLVEEHLRGLGMEVRTGIAHTGVVGILKGSKPGPVVALRADMDALPVTEKSGLEFASRVKAQYQGREVGVMHACGHDTHTAMLMGEASVLSKLRDQLHGTVMFIFQPAEEGAPEGEEWGAKLMLAEGVFDALRPEAVFALHITSRFRTGTIQLREGIAAAGASTYQLEVEGRQTHGASPWAGIDPIVLSSQIINAWQTIPSRHINLNAAPAPVLTVGTIHGGERHNIIPERVDMSGTVRYYEDSQRDRIFELMESMANGIAEPVGGHITLNAQHDYIPVVNNPELTQQVYPLLDWAAMGDVHMLSKPLSAAEDFSFFAREVPGVNFVLGAAPTDGEPASNHSPFFTIDEPAMRVGVRALAALALYWNEGI